MGDQPEQTERFDTDTASNNKFTFLSAVKQTASTSWAIWKSSAFWLLLFVTAAVHAAAWQLQFSGWPYDVSSLFSSKRNMAMLVSLHLAPFFAVLVASSMRVDDGKKALLASEFKNPRSLAIAFATAAVFLLLIGSVFGGPSLGIWNFPAALLFLIVAFNILVVATQFALAGKMKVSSLLKNLILPRGSLLLAAIPSTILFALFAVAAETVGGESPLVRGALTGIGWLFGFVPLMAGAHVFAVALAGPGQKPQPANIQQTAESNPAKKSAVVTDVFMSFLKSPMGKRVGASVAAITIVYVGGSALFGESAEERALRLAAFDDCTNAAGYTTDPAHEGREWPALTNADRKPAKAVDDCMRALELDDDNLTLIFQLGMAHLGNGSTQTGLTMVQQAADDDYAMALHTMGNMAWYGTYNQTKDIAKAERYYMQALDAGYTHALRLAADSYMSGDGVRPDIEKALSFYDKGADAGNLESLQRLAEIFDSENRADHIPDAIGSDDAKAYSYYKRAASLGDGEALARQLEMLAEGRGVSKDPEQAFQMAQQASDDRSTGGAAQLARMYHHGLGTDQDYDKAHTYYMRANNEGDGAGAYGLGQLFEEGLGREKDVRNAYSWYLRAAKNGSLAAAERHSAWLLSGENKSQLFSQIFTAYQPLLHDGHGQPMMDLGLWSFRGRRYDDALKAYDAAAAGGVADGWRRLGLLYLYNLPSASKLPSRMRGDGTLPTTRRLAQAKNYFETGVKRGDVQANYGLALIHFYGMGEKRNRNKAYPLFRKAAEAGNVNAKVFMAKFYAMGRFVAKDTAKAEQYLLEAMDAQHPTAAFDLGYMLYMGDNLRQDYRRARKMFEYSIERYDDPASKYYLGRTYLYAQGVAKMKQNERDGVKLIREAANDGYSAAMNTLGLAYQDGKGVKQNNGTARSWFRRAGEAGDPLGYYNLGRAYYNGIGVWKNSEKAIEYFVKAGNLGDAHSQFMVGIMTAKGIGTRKSQRTADKWFKVAADQGHKDAKRYLNNPALIYQEQLTDTLNILGNIYGRAIDGFNSMEFPGRGNMFKKKDK